MICVINCLIQLRRFSIHFKPTTLIKKTIKIFIVIGILILIKFWFGFYEHDEFGGSRLFIKHRPIWKTYFYSPRGMSDLQLHDMSKERQYEQKLFDEFILENQEIE